MPQLTYAPEHAPAVSAALLFMAEKYRQIITRADLFDDGGIADDASQVERKARRLVAMLPAQGITNYAEANMAVVALDALADDINRKVQLLSGRGQVQDAALLEHRLREVYAARAGVEGTAQTFRATESPVGADD
jgi:hypothetical protein